MTLKTVFSAHVEAGLEAPTITQEQFNDALTEFRQHGMSIDGDNAYKRDLCDVIVGALAAGKQDLNPPPPGHWCQEFWDIGRGEGRHQAKLIEALQQVTDCLSKALTGGSVQAVEAGRALAAAGNLLQPNRT